MHLTIATLSISIQDQHSKAAGFLQKHRGGGGCYTLPVFSLLFLDRGWGVKWILKLAAAGGEGPSVDIMEISKPDDLGDIANLGLSLMEAKQLLARVQLEISSAQARG